MVEKFKGKQPIQLIIQNKIKQGETTETFSLSVTGDMYYIGQACFIAYEAKMDDEGSAEKIKVSIKINGKDQVLINRENSRYHMRMPLMIDKETLVYSKVAGLQQVEMIGKLLAFEFTQTGVLAGALDCAYQLFSNEELIGVYQLKLQYSPSIV